MGFDITKEDILSKESFLFYKDENRVIYDYLSNEKKNILFVIGASKVNKLYSKEKFVKIINGLDYNCLIIWGSVYEKEVSEYIASNSHAKILPPLDLNSVKALIAKVDLVIGNDTGPTHMAWALNTASITLFGNTPGYRNTYLTNINKILESNTTVNPSKLDKNDLSISQIKEERVIDLAKSLLYG